MARRAAHAISVLVLNLDVRRPSRTLSDVEKQLVELGFALTAAPKVLILDEPTAALPRHESELLFERVRHIAAEGAAVLFVTHRLHEVLQITDEVTVLRDGRHVWTRPTAEVDHDEIIRGMVGRSVTFERDPELQPGNDVAYEVTGLSDPSGAYRDVSLSLRRGEIYGIYGLVGAGQSELCHGLFGLRQTTETGRADSGIRLGYVPADRHTQGVFHQMTVGENLSIANLETLSRRGVLDLNKERDEIEKYMKDLLVKATGPSQRVTELSGGNQQKVLLGRWLMTRPDVLVLEEPTQGVDVGAKGQIHDLVRDLARRGVTVILVSSEIPELLALSHRIAVMREGRLVREFDADSATEDALLRESLPESQAESGSRTVASAAEVPSWKRALRWIAARREAGLAGFVVLLLALFAMVVPNFATVENLRDVLLNNTIILVGALGMTMVILAGGIDISLGAILALAAVAAGKTAELGWPAVAVLATSLALGALLGAINGGLTVFGRVHSIVITLGTLLIFRAFVRLWTGGYQLINLPSEATWVREVEIAGVPVLLVIGLLVLIVVNVFLKYTRTGRCLYVLGGSRESAEFLGVYPRTVLPVAFALCGLLAGLAGMLWAGRLGQVQIAVGEGFELTVIAAVVVGGTHIMGGRGSAIGTFLGAFFLGVVRNVLILMEISAFWQQAVYGAMILLALAADAVLARAEEGES
jgi:ABC-type sugar transport system ATPase subunit/ribose/xylose/arabinose/galactoside ABC-type transport system permease subunit